MKSPPRRPGPPRSSRRTNASETRSLQRLRTLDTGSSPRYDVARMSKDRQGAIVGFGFIAEKGHLPAYLARRDFAVVAVADVCAARRELARKLLPQARIYEDAQ